jgi:GDP-mannose 6-dehydrogenase
MDVAIFGLGYVGAVTAACLASRGHRVIGVDPDLAKVISISGGNAPVVEPELGALVANAVASHRLTATTDPAVGLDTAAVALLCVGTPPRGADGGVDLASVEHAATEIGTYLRTSEQYLAVVVRSTVPPGTIERVVIPALEQASGRGLGDGFGVASCPEFLREGTGVVDFFDPPFTVVGADEERCAKVVSELLSFLDRRVRIVPIATAEALKYACNAFHALKISFANELGRVCRPLDVDARDVLALLCEDERLNISAAYLRPGFAFGGSCLPKDLDALLHVARVNFVDTPLLSGVRATNELVIRAAMDEVLATGFRRVTLLGLSFKPETDDLRSSPFVELAERLLGKGIDLTIYDPVVQPDRLLGANRRYVEHRLPHLQRLLVDDLERSLVRSDVVVVGYADSRITAAITRCPPRCVVDLAGRLGDDIETLPGYRAVTW